MIKAKNWSGKDLKGAWEFTIKIDGVRALRKGTGWVSRNDKPLYNIPVLRDCGALNDCEVYCGGFKTTIERVRAKTKDRPISVDQLFSLAPLDARLQLGSRLDPTAKQITKLMHEQIAKGYEGLVLGQGDVWLKVKPIETFDVPITDMLAGTGKHVGRMGALMTPMGKVGTGFTDLERQFWWDRRFALSRGDTIIEVECMKLTDDGKFRHPRFVRVRPDK